MKEFILSFSDKEIIITIVGLICSIISFIAGVYSKYFSDKMTDRRKEREKKKATIDKFKQLELEMPEFFFKLREKLNQKTFNELELFMHLDGGECNIANSIDKLFDKELTHDYYMTLIEYLRRLLEEGFIENTTIHNSKFIIEKRRLKNHFKELLCPDLFK